MIRCWLTPRKAIQHRGYCPAPGEVGSDYKAAYCTCHHRVRVTLRGHYTHHKAYSASQREEADLLLPKLTKIQINGLCRYAKRGSWYRVHHVHGHTIHSLEAWNLITRRGRHVTPLDHAVFTADRAQIPDIFDDLFSNKRKAVR